MKTVFIITAIILPQVIFSGTNWPENPEIIHPEVTTISGIENPSFHADTVNCNCESETELFLPSVLIPKWGSDVLVCGNFFLTASKTNLPFDYDRFGRLYTAISIDHSIFDTLWIFTSTDKGQTWTRKFDISISSTPYICDILYHDMKIQHGVSNPEIYQFFLIDNGYDTTLWFRTIDLYNQNPVWLRFAPDSLFSQISRFSFDISGDSFYFVYIRHPDAEGSKAVRMFSSDHGVTWTRQAVTDFPCRNADITARPDGHCYIVYDRLSETDILIHRYNQSGSLIDIQTVSNQGTYSCYPTVSSARFKPWGESYVYVAFQEGTGITTRAKISTSSDGGNTWTIGETWSVAGDVNSRKPFVEFNRSDTLDRCLGIAVNSDNYELKICLNEHGGNWDSVITINDHMASSEVQSQGSFVSSQINSQIAVIYRQFGTDSIWFDGSLLTTSVDEIGENLGFVKDKNGIKIFFVSPENTTGKIEVIDISGRIIETIFEGRFNRGENNFQIPYDDLENRTPGVFFIVVNSSLFTRSFKVSMIK